MFKKVSTKTLLKVGLISFLIALFVYLLFSEDGLMDLLKNPTRLSKGWLAMAVVCQLINIAIDGCLIYKFALNSCSHYKFTQAIRSSMVGQFYNAVTPGASGGQPMQVYLMSQQGLDAGISTSTLTQKFLVYQTSLTLYSAATIILQFDYFTSLNKIVWTVAMFGFAVQALVIVALLLFSFSPKITSKLMIITFMILEKLHIIKNAKQKIENIEFQLTAFHQGNRDLYKNKSLVLEAYVLTFVQLTATFLVPYCVYRSFSLSGRPVLDLICAQSFVTMASSFVPIPGSSGAAEGASSIFFADFFGDSTIKPAILITRIVYYYFTVLLSSPFARIKKSQKKDKKLQKT